MKKKQKLLKAVSLPISPQKSRFDEPFIDSVKEILCLDNLEIPNYQRPYKWGIHNVIALLEDIEYAIKQADRFSGFKYRVGTIIFYNEEGSISKFNVVDGQQRILTLALVCKALNVEYDVPVLDIEVSSKESEINIQRNFKVIKDYFIGKNDENKNAYIDAISTILQFVIVSTKHLAEAFQLFDSQNTRGKALAPHDLLKAFHLREMRDHPNEMKHTVEKWEQTNPNKIHELFKDYLFPIKCWVDREKGHEFTSSDIDDYKGVQYDSPYFYAMRTVKGMPIFQIDQPFVSGRSFFEFVDHYLNIFADANTAIYDSELDLFLDGKGAGFSYAKQLFICAVMFYYDRFRNFDKKHIKRLYVWAFMIRLQMQNLGFDTVKNYAIGIKEGEDAFLAMFYKLKNCKKDSDIMKFPIYMLSEENIRYKPKNGDHTRLLPKIQAILGIESGDE